MPEFIKALFANIKLRTTKLTVMLRRSQSDVQIAI